MSSLFPSPVNQISHKYGVIGAPTEALYPFRYHLTLISRNKVVQLSRREHRPGGKIILCADSDIGTPIYTRAVNIENSPLSLDMLKSQFLAEGFEPRTFHDIHACLVRVNRLGVLITGNPGAGKSSLVQALLGHDCQLISDDVVELEWADDRSLLGVSPLTGASLLMVGGRLIDLSEIRGPDDLECKIDLNVHIGEENASSMSKITGFDLSRWYISAPETHLFYRCIEAFTSKARSGLTGAVIKSYEQGMPV